MQTRYYDPETGRFISQDDYSYLAPETINGLNLYAYCADNPIMYVDPMGTSISSFFKKIGNWFADTFGFAGYNSYTKTTKYREDYFVSGIEYGTEQGVTFIAGDDSKPVTFYYEKPDEWWKIWEYKLGVKINTNNFGLNKSIGLSNSIGIKIGDTAVSINNEMEFNNQFGLPSIIKTSLRFSTGVSYRNFSSEGFISWYINPLQIIFAAVVIYFANVFGIGFLVLLSQSPAYSY